MLKKENLKIELVDVLFGGRELQVTLVDENIVWLGLNLQERATVVGR